MSSLDQRVDALFENLSSDPQQRLDAVALIYAAIRERAARHLEPAIRTLVEEAHTSGHEHKLGLSRRINHVLQDARLAIADPSTQLPSALIAHRPRPSSHTSRFCLVDTRTASDGKRHTFRLAEQEDASSLDVIHMPANEDGLRRRR
jgi:hypothetical protein